MSADVLVRLEDGVPWIGDRSFPWASGVDADDRDYESGSSRWSHHTRRFRLTFENGWTLSVIWGNHAYCSNYTHNDEDTFSEASPDAEIGAWLGPGELLPWDDGDTVKGHVPASDLLSLIDSMMGWPSDFPAGSVLTLDGIKVGVA